MSDSKDDMFSKLNIFRNIKRAPTENSMDNILKPGRPISKDLSDKNTALHSQKTMGSKKNREDS